MGATKTKAKTGAPPGGVKEKPLRRRLSLGGALDAPVPDNLSIPTDQWADLNFKVSPAFHRAFKKEATDRGWSMKELLEASLRMFLEKHQPNYDEKYGDIWTAK